MTRVRVKGFQIFHDRHGRLRCYHRATRTRIDLAVYPFGSAEFFAQCEAIRTKMESQKILSAKPGTLAGLLKIYFESDHFRDNLRHRTQSDYRRCANYLKPIGNTPVHIITVPLVAGIHDKAAVSLGWRRANMLLTVLSEVFKLCVPKGLIDRNFATGVIPKRRPKSRSYPNRPWSWQEREVVLERAAPQLKAALALMMNTALDPSDAFSLQKEQLVSGVIRGVRGKTGQEVAIPVSSTLRHALSEAPEHEAPTILASTRNQPWTYNGFSSSWIRFRSKLEDEKLIKAGLTLKGLRHTVATTLREAGLEERRIADLLGQKTLSMARHYSRSADLVKNNLATIEVLEEANELRSKKVKPQSKDVKPNSISE